MNKRLGFRTLALIATAALVAGCGSGAAQSDSLAQSELGQQSAGVEVGRGGEEVKVGLTYVPSVQFAPVYVAAADQIFRAAGVGAVIRHHGSDEGLFTALVAGDEDITVASGDEVLQARAAGMDLVAIGSYYNQHPVAIIAKEGSGINSLQDLRGKSIGLPGEFGSNWFGLLAALQEAGLSRSDVNIVSIGYTQAAALAADQVDAVVGFVNSDAVQLQQMDVPISVIPLAEFDVPLVGATLVTTEEWLGTHPDLARATIGAITAGMDRVISNPQHALEIAALWDTSLSSPSARETAAKLLNATIPLWEGPTGSASTIQDLATWQRMAPFLADVLDVPVEDMGVETAVTNDYAVGP